jgi:hypothetical protein
VRFFSEISPRTFRLGLLIAVALHLIIVALFFTDAIRDEYHIPGTFNFHNGGDQSEYFEFARSILRGEPARTRFTLGYPLLLAPWLVAFPTANALTMTGYVAAFNALILFPVSQVVLAWLGVLWLRSRTRALIAVLIWTLLPLALYLFMAVIGRAGLGAIWAVHLPWLQMLSEPPTTFLTLISFVLLVLVINEPRLLTTIALGFVCGVLILIRMNAALSVLAIGAVLLLRGRWRELLIVGALIGATFTPQLIYNAVNFGNPFSTGYAVIDTAPPYGLFSTAYLLEALTGRVGGILALGIFAGVVLFPAGILRIWRINQDAAISIGIWIVAYLGFFSLYFHTWDGGITRFLIPMYPAVGLFAAGLFKTKDERYSET